MELFGNSILYNVSKLEVDIELNLTNCSSSNQSTKSSLGSTYTTNIYPDEHTDFSTFSVYMGSVDITSQVTTYNVGYNTITIPLVNSDISITSICGVETYTITKTLTGCTSSNSASAIVYGASYTTTITASPNYTMEGATVAITMGGVDITSTAWDSTNNTITINSVTGNLIFNIVAVYDAVIVEFTMNYNSAVSSGIFPASGNRLTPTVAYRFENFDFYFLSTTSSNNPYIGSSTADFLRTYNGLTTFKFTANTGYKVSDILVTAIDGGTYNNYTGTLIMNSSTDPDSATWALSTPDTLSVEIGGNPVQNAIIDFKPNSSQFRMKSIKVTLIKS